MTPAQTRKRPRKKAPDAANQGKSRARTPPDLPATLRRRFRALEAATTQRQEARDAARAARAQGEAAAQAILEEATRKAGGAHAKALRTADRARKQDLEGVASARKEAESIRAGIESRKAALSIEAVPASPQEPRDREPSGDPWNRLLHYHDSLVASFDACEAARAEFGRCSEVVTDMDAKESKRVETAKAHRARLMQDVHSVRDQGARQDLAYANGLASLAARNRRALWFMGLKSLAAFAVAMGIIGAFGANAVGVWILAGVVAIIVVVWTHGNCIDRKGANRERVETARRRDAYAKQVERKLATAKAQLRDATAADAMARAAAQEAKGLALRLVQAAKDTQAEAEAATAECIQAHLPRLLEAHGAYLAALEQDEAVAREAHATEVSKADDRRRRSQDDALETHAASCAVAEARFWDALATADDAWCDVRDAFDETVTTVDAAQAAWFPDDHGPSTAPEGSHAPPPFLPLGSIRHVRPRVERGAPMLDEATEEQFVPAVLEAMGDLSVMVDTDGPTSGTPVDLLNRCALRLLQGLPPGKARFTFIDPISLGDNFAPFMHLKDKDEDIVSNRIWTDPRHIEEKLGTIVEHMETVIQSFLLGRYETLEAYNLDNKDVKEPYHFLVVADFPRRFTAKAAEELLRIAASGRRCGVHVLMTHDRTQEPPQDFDLAALQNLMVRLRWDGGWHWDDADLGHLPLRTDGPPRPDVWEDALLRLGDRALTADQIRVPFDTVAPRDGLWTNSSDTELQVPIGKHGVKKLQRLVLGKATAQHVVVAGKTGSGKSTLLHALITNAALHYAPSELELYLIDFKKGVEFKPYADARLPHARVIAIESDPEFGLSVLRRLDAELARRGDLFRSYSVQDMASYREVSEEDCPRILLVVDEFQEFFVDPKGVGDEARLLLDRLVRQGRAFGMHVLLGSQSLGGSSSLPTSTLDQMAVRVALQSSEADAMRIFDSHNPAARSLKRPGDAIYNDHSGHAEGNQRFQVVWMDDDERLRRLEQVRDHAEAVGVEEGEQVVFEGHVPARVESNRTWARLMDGYGEEPLRLEGWLGESVSIDGPAAVRFRPQAASNLLMVGRDAEAAVGMTGALVLALADRLVRRGNGGHGENREEGDVAGGGAPILVVDGTPVDADVHGILPHLVGHAGDAVRVLHRNAVGRAILDLAAEVDRRISDEAATSFSPRFLVLQGAHRVRSLRQVDPRQSYGHSRDTEPDPHAALQAIVRDGPEVGVHTVVWCDDLQGASRLLDRGTLREFEMRVAMQMPASDSTGVVDAPTASTLGRNRALLYHEEQGGLRKFRPYAVPSEAWLERYRRVAENGARA